MSPVSVCIFCLKHESRVTESCTYGLKHEFPEVVLPKISSEKKVDPALCAQCGLHPKNPASRTNGCEHSYG